MLIVLSDIGCCIEYLSFLNWSEVRWIKSLSLIWYNFLLDTKIWVLGDNWHCFFLDIYLFIIYFMIISWFINLHLINFFSFIQELSNFIIIVLTIINFWSILHLKLIIFLFQNLMFMKSKRFFHFQISLLISYTFRAWTRWRWREFLLINRIKLLLSLFIFFIMILKRSILFCMLFTFINFWNLLVIWCIIMSNLIIKLAVRTILIFLFCFLLFLFTLCIIYWFKTIKLLIGSCLKSTLIFNFQIV